MPLSYPRDSSKEEVNDHYYSKLNYLAQHLYINDDYKFIYLSVPKVGVMNGGGGLRSNDGGLLIIIVSQQHAQI